MPRAAGIKSVEFLTDTNLEQTNLGWRVTHGKSIQLVLLRLIESATVRRCWASTSQLRCGRFCPQTRCL